MTRGRRIAVWAGSILLVIGLLRLVLKYFYVGLLARVVFAVLAPIHALIPIPLDYLAGICVVVGLIVVVMGARGTTARGTTTRSAAPTGRFRWKLFIAGTAGCALWVSFPIAYYVIRPNMLGTKPELFAPTPPGVDLTRPDGLALLIGLGIGVVVMLGMLVARVFDAAAAQSTFQVIATYITYFLALPAWALVISIVGFFVLAIAAIVFVPLFVLAALFGSSSQTVHLRPGEVLRIFFD